jgi:hypothetical protein
MFTKDQLVSRVIQELSEKVFTLKKDIQSLVRDSSENSKPTSGDKHEVGLEMSMGELDRLSGQLDAYKRQLSELELMDLSGKTKVGKGSIVQTNRGLFFISVAYGLVKLEKEAVFCLSPQSPLAIAFAGSGEGDSILLNDLEHSILSVR